MRKLVNRQLSCPPRLLTAGNTKRITALCLSALLSVGFIPTAALADDVALPNEQMPNEVIEEVATEPITTQATLDTTQNEVADVVEPTSATDNKIEPDTESSVSDFSLETNGDDNTSTVDESTSPELGIEYPPPPENSSDNETISVVEELPTENLFYEPAELYSEESSTSADDLSSISTWENIASDKSSQALAGDFIYELETEQNFDYQLGTYVDTTYALITNYIGTNRNVVIPATLQGYPVKLELGFGGFLETHAIDTLTLSEGVDYDIYGASNSEDSSIRILNLPSTWDGGGSVFNLPNLQAINIAADNPKYYSIDGVVYTKDTKALECYPANKPGATFTIPSGITTIERGAFSGTKNLQTLNVPDSVTTIGFAALIGNSLETINLGKGVKNIAPEAFSAYNNYLQDKTGAYVNADHTPDYHLSQINVDPQNPYYSSEDGVLYNKDKTEILCYPQSKKGESFTAPTSVVSIGSYAFYSCVYLTKEIVFPSKIYNISEDAIGGNTVFDGSPFTFWPLEYIVFLKGINNPADVAGDSIWTFPTCYFEEGNITFGYEGTKLVGDDSVRQFANGSRGWYADDYLSISEYQAQKNQVKTRGSWMQDSTGWWYKNADGSYPKNAWAQIGGAWYHFNKSGYMQTGWQQIGGTWYYLKPSGAMATGWTQVGSTWYYLNASGAMQTGWTKVGNTWYYLKSSGAMQTGWYKVGSSWYYSNASGAMQANRWIGNYWVGASGAMATNTTVDGGRYRVDANGLWVR